jgi:two-component system, LytTR family, response regulator
MSIKAVIADDEPLARERIRTLLAGERDIEIVAEATNGAEAVQLVREHHPDLLFLDVQMPGMDGFGAIEQLASEVLPSVVFVTAYDEYALQAFEVNALDYLLKPFNRTRFQKTLRRAREHVLGRANGDISKKLVSLLESLRSNRLHLDRIVIRNAGRVTFLPTSEIDWVEAAGNYVKIFSGKDQHILRETLKNLETRLDPSLFVRVHRSTILNVERIRELQPLFHGDCIAILRDGTRITCSRSFSDRLDALLRND